MARSKTVSTTRPPSGDPARSPIQQSAPPPTDDRPPEALDPAHRDAVEEGLEQARGGRFAPDGDVEALYRRAGL